MNILIKSDMEDNLIQTFLCFDSGCIHIQGMSSIALGIFSAGMGIYLI